ncbi:hypothetical protein DPMN_110040 [Dreissena polymorpha]|uniref:Uncharacterized protein n=1 Tax=Dreissena polymorpha TaxID=45954 RepID=A0A9D4QMR5_DREPO|nr:hypothetical protein DPMN_110040 [Dreissena polymorpha]
MADHYKDPNTKVETVYAACASMQAFAKVSMADKVWVRSIEASEIAHYDIDKWTTFCGFLVRV